MHYYMGVKMTIEEFIRKNWENFNYSLGLDLNSSFYEYRKILPDSAIKEIKFWIEKAQEFYQQKLQWQPAKTAPKTAEYFIGVFLNPEWVKSTNIPQYEIAACQRLDYDNYNYNYNAFNKCFPADTLKYWLPLSTLPPIPEAKKELVLEVGKYYRTAQGKFYFIGRSSWIREDYLIGEIEKHVVSLKLSEIISEWEE